MFGHDDQMQNQVDEIQPTPDGTLTSDVQPMATAPGIDIATTGNYTDAIDGSQLPEAPVEPIIPDTTQQVNSTPSAPTNTDQLLDLKQQALQQLTPLIGHLEQDPEEKFRTTMMMIQASDNSALVKTAYDAALQIPGEKERAQALLDIVNEINYFTHVSTGSEA